MKAPLTGSFFIWAIRSPFIPDLFLILDCVNSFAVLYLNTQILFVLSGRISNKILNYGNILMKFKTILLTLGMLLLLSCNNSPVKKPATHTPQDSTVSESLVNLDDILINSKSGDAKIVEVYRTDIQEKGERKYLEAAKAYRDGDLKIARLNFDQLLEHLEYFYGDEKLSDSLMLINFVDESDSDKLESDDKDIFQLYTAIYSEGNIEGTETQLQVQENKTQPVKTNSGSKLVEQVRADVRAVLAARGIKSVDDSFLKDVSDAFEEYAADRTRTREIILRAAKYESFIKATLTNEGLDPYFFYIPAVMTTYYNEKNNGGIWGLANTRSWRKIRNDVGASTALIVNMLKKQVKKTTPILVISEIVKARNYGFKNDFNVGQLYNSDFAGFLAIALILENPARYGFNDLAEAVPKEEDFDSSYKSFVKNPDAYIAEKQKSLAEPVKVTKNKEIIDKKDNKGNKGNKGNTTKEQIKLKYTVQKGDNLQKVASLFKVDVDEIANQNPKSVKKQQLFAGSVLIIKTSAVDSYQAKSGDNMSEICKNFNMSLSEFMDLNNLDEKQVYKGRRYYVYKN